MICGIYEEFSGSLAPCRDRPLQITNNMSSTSVSNNWRHTASNPQGCLPVSTETWSILKLLNRNGAVKDENNYQKVADR